MTITLITGANKGIGRETARRLVEIGHTVYLGSRDAGRGQAAAPEVGGSFLHLDVTDQSSVAAAARQLADREGRLDLLINNAGIPDNTVGSGGIDGDTASRVLDTNVAGVVRVTQAVLPLLHASHHPHVMNVGSGLGSFWANTDPQRPESQTPLIVYAASNAAVAMLTLKYAQALPGIWVNAACPGLTDTDFTAGFPSAAPVSDAVEVIVDLAVSTDDRTGTVVEASGPLPW